MDSLANRAAAWMAKNPVAMAAFESLAWQMLSTGRRGSIAMMTEVVRWKVRFETTAGEAFKINNSYRAYIARDLIARHPGLKKLLATRQTKARWTLFKDVDISGLRA